MTSFKSLLGVFLVGSACHASYAASGVVRTGPEAIPAPKPAAAPCPAAPASSAAATCCETANVKGFAKILLCIAEGLCAKNSCAGKPECPPYNLSKRDRDALLEHITDTLAKLGSLEDDAKRKDVQDVLREALASTNGKSNVAREVLALIASMPSKPPKKVTVTAATKREGKGCCLKGECKTTETTEVSAEPVAPAPLSNAVVEKIKNKLCQLRKCCAPAECSPASCCPTQPADRCERASCFDVRWDLLNMLIMDAEHRPTRDRAEIAQELKKIAEELTGIAEQLRSIATSLQYAELRSLGFSPLMRDLWFMRTLKYEKELTRIAEQITKVASKLPAAQESIADELNGMADDVKRLANRWLASQALMAELCAHDKLLETPCGIRILLRAIDGAGEVHEPFQAAFEMNSLLTR
jgi:hypothetical protein